jgi:hypothetical protein
MEPISIITSNTWYYSLSTIAQTLAALTGLFAVFVVFKIQSMLPMLEDARLAFMRLIDNYSGAISGYWKKGFEELHFLSEGEILKEVKKINQIKKESPERLKVIIPGSPSIAFRGLGYDINDEGIFYYENLLSKKKLVVQMFLVNFLYNLFIITACLGLLIFSDFFSPYYTLIIRLAPLVALALILLGYTTYRIIKS